MGHKNEEKKMAFTVDMGDKRLTSGAKKILGSSQVTNLMTRAGYDNARLELHELDDQFVPKDVYWCLFPKDGSVPLFAVKASSVSDHGQPSYDFIELEPHAKHNLYRRRINQTVE